MTVTWVSCEICGKRTRSVLRVCVTTPECASEAHRRRYPTTREADIARLTATYRETHPDRRRPCELCGIPTVARLGICKQNPECIRERNRRYNKLRSATPRAKPEGVPCEVCGRLTRNKYRVCATTPECASEHSKRRRKLGRPDAPCEVCALCGGPTYSTLGVCGRNPECKKEQIRRYTRARPERVRERERRYARQQRLENPEKRAEYLARTDRPCRYRKSGCAEFAILSGSSCREHTYRDNARHKARRRRNLSRRLAVLQGWTCTWCLQPLPEDLAETHLDHIIPVARGGPNEDWNLQVLHDRCNHEKHAWITPEALALAEEHDVIIIAG